MQLGLLLNQLYESKAYPPNWMNRSLAEVLDGLRSIGKLDAREAFGVYTTLGACSGDKVGLEQQVHDIVEKVEKVAVGICLDCVRNGPVRSLVGRCRIPH